VTSTERWPRRPIPPDLAEHYRRSGWWTDATLGAMVADGLSGMHDVAFRVRSSVRGCQV